MTFWFGLSDEQHWSGDPELDAEIRARFEGWWTALRQQPAEEFLATPDQALAGAILFDQLPRNMFRGHAEQFSTDLLARAIAAGAVDHGLDERLAPERRTFLYMPFEHSEKRDDQRRSLLLFARLGEPRQLDYARRHRDIVERFGRFPHRNVMLGRVPTEEERAAGSPEPF
ncbi:DUF924 domain-containing protein [Sphingomonas ginkgonis]|uniref:DUF924 domain-containing protein n=1 Tax=Sphingomonas ginkgonis TaxID=2315330 RepID=A0A3R9WQS9_9SPHN|nr:DUF924 domain-containing protein [Sphingomonas ginkgonis]